MKPGFYLKNNGEKIILCYEEMYNRVSKIGVVTKMTAMMETMVYYYPTPRIEKFILPIYLKREIESGEWEFFEEFIDE